MIPLHQISAAKVLEGARVPLVPSFLRDRPLARIEWCNDHLIMSEVNRTNAARTELDRCDRDGFSMFLLDPTDPDTARLIDRRIAEAIPTYRPPPNDHTVPWHALLWKCDHRTQRGKRHWHVTGTHAEWGPDGKSRVATVPDMPCLAGLEIGYETLPEARRRLLVALYPPEVR